jgi:preprotein translocase YajC subunit
LEEFKMSEFLTFAMTTAAGAEGAEGAQGGSMSMIIMMVALFAAMYFFTIRPQKKQQKMEQEIRENTQIGDEITTIGGICGKIVKTKDESIIIAVGADKVKFEMKRWAVSTVETHANRNKKVEEPSVEEEEVKKVMPKKLKKSSDIEGDE